MDESRHASPGSKPSAQRESEFQRQWEGSLEAQRIRLRTQQSQVDSLERRILILWFVAVFLVAAVVGGGLWGYGNIEKNEAAVAELGDTQGFRAMIEAVDARVDSFAELITDLSADSEIIQGFADRIAALEMSTSATFESLRDQVRETARMEAQSRVEESQMETARRLEEIGPRIREVESSQETSREQLSRLEQEVARMRSDVDGQLAALDLRTSDSVRAVEERVAGNERGVEAVSWEVGRERLDFELFEGYRAEVAPGILLDISDADVGHQKVDGWLHLVGEGRIVRLEDQPIQQAVVFYGLDEQRSYELVFTRVRPEAAIGYVRVPADEGMRIVNEVRDPAFDGRQGAGEQLSAVR